LPIKTNEITSKHAFKSHKRHQKACICSNIKIKTIYAFFRIYNHICYSFIYWQQSEANLTSMEENASLGRSAVILAFGLRFLAIDGLQVLRSEMSCNYNTSYNASWIKQDIGKWNIFMEEGFPLYKAVANIGRRIRGKWITRWSLL
jgi:hypothetical protein